MNYFDQLLESYSRLKKRKLVLLEKEEKKKTKEEQKVEYDAVGRQKLEAFWNAAATEYNNEDAQLMNSKGAPYAYKKITKGPPERTVTVIRGGPLGSGSISGATLEEAENASTGAPAQVQKLVNYFSGEIPDELTQQIQGADLGSVLDRAGESISPALDEVGVPDTVKTKIIFQFQQMLGLASDLVIAARDIGKGAAKKPWAGWKEETEEEPGRWVGRDESRADDDGTPEGTRSVGPYIAGASRFSLETQIANGKTVTIDPDAGVVYGSLVRDPMLIQGANDSILRFMELGKNKVTDNVKKCEEVGSRVKIKGDRLIFLKNANSRDGIAIKRNDVWKFVESQILERCKQGIKAVPKANYDPQELNDMRGKGMEAGAVTVGVIDNIDNMPKPKGMSDADYEAKKDDLAHRFGLKIRNDILQDEAKFNAAYINLKESLDNDDALDAQSLFVAETMQQLAGETDSVEKLRAFLQRIYDLERPVVDALRPDFTFPYGLKTGIGIADDLKYAYLSHADAVKAAKTMKLVGDPESNVETVKVSDIIAFDEDLGEIFKEVYGLGDDTEVHMVGSGMKSQFKEGMSKVGEMGSQQQRSDVIHGLADNVVEGFVDVTLDRLGLKGADEFTRSAALEGIREYQNVLDGIQGTLDTVLPSETTVAVNSDGNRESIDFATLTIMVDKKAQALNMSSEAKKSLTSLISDFQGVTPDLNGPENEIQRLDLKEELYRLMSTAKQYQDMTNAKPQLVPDMNAAGGQRSETSEEAAVRLVNARRNAAFTIHMGGGVKKDSVLNKKILNDNTVRAGSHMSPIIAATDGLLDPESGHQISVADGGVSMIFTAPNGEAVTLGQERTRSSPGKPASTRTVVKLNQEAQHNEAGIGVEQTIDIKNPKEEGLMITFLKGQAKLVEELLSTQTI